MRKHSQGLPRRDTRGGLKEVDGASHSDRVLRKKSDIMLIVSRQNIARPFAAPPGVPAERVAALRRAFDETMRDPDFLAEARLSALEVRPASGAQVQTLFGEITAAPPEVVSMAAEMIKEAR